jgi:hypothetical protein
MRSALFAHLADRSPHLIPPFRIHLKSFSELNVDMVVPKFNGICRLHTSRI